MFKDIPPVGGKTSWDTTCPPPEFEGYESLFVDSGTSALALALVAARIQHGGECPEVILPAYGCPDLVAATMFAGCKPVIVDIAAPDDPALCLEQLKAALNPNTAAVVAVNFLGVRERLLAIKKLLPVQTLLVEDNAQWYPELSEGVILHGHLTVNSFGRGKPASILGGGMLLMEAGLAGQVRDNLLALLGEANNGGGIKRKLITKVYNLLLNPYLYFWLNRNPLLSVGATHYDKLETVSAMPACDLARVGANIECYLSQSRRVEEALDVVVRSNACLSSPGLDVATRRGRLLRYPLIASSAVRRDELVEKMRAFGLTKMYQRALPFIDGVAHDVNVFDDVPNARAFAQRFLTLPVHTGVSAQALKLISQELNKSL
ncbi:DegT/DnrJ/EryC1/StrS family aminotransferase [Saccharophagus degradans]|uniref:DegT/DnrJ/EryC1/StrS family aminotransferase n=1 Tax=Saccharophagus degradans TaxID=86304 RepID=A0AAW7XB37_9GAMM|nr:DegT/DnrJ/EryC1/StrS family aminotransferase [Saccharophagus degradans]MDO6424878.1 DegT/DnrJ/EryC1/StrS family aminotransferase [Saccharophagus degradans]MDO6606666.1 DegT/DnrJ/EryC1/StrS family aminotransferase [Saccharophagus degradans]